MKQFTVGYVIAVFFMVFAFTAINSPETNSPVVNAPTIDASAVDAALATQIMQAAKKIAAELSDIELAGQVIMTGVDAAPGIGVSREEQARLARIKPGAIMLFRKNLNKDDAACRAMTAKLAAAAALPDLPPFIAVDQEGGAVERVKSASARLPSPASYAELIADKGEAAVLDAIRRDAEKSARHLFSIGITLNLAPVAEPLNNENKKFLKDRAYGDAAWTAKAAAAFIQGMKAGGVACVAKHFPGNTGVDPHRALPVIRGSAAELDAQIAPFRALSSSAAGIMAAHSVAAAWDAKRGASISPIVIQKKIKDEMSFAGFVLADDFSMGAASSGGLAENGLAKGNLDAAKTIASLAAGADMIMAWPANVSADNSAILKALETGVLTRERLRDAASRIIAQKLLAEKFGL